MDRKLERKIREFCNIINKDLIVCFDDTYYYDFVNERVCFAPDALTDNGFMRHLREYHTSAEGLDLPILTWSILHEIGHFYTWDEKFEDEDELLEKYCYTHFPCETFEQCVEMQNAYFDMESEWEATEWAIEFAKENLPLVEAFTKYFK